MRKEFEDGIIIRPFEPCDEPLVREFFAGLGGMSRAMFDRADYNSKRALSCFTPQAPEAEKGDTVVSPSNFQFVYRPNPHQY